MLTCVFSILDYQKDLRSWQNYIRQLASQFQKRYLVLWMKVFTMATLSRKSSRWTRKERFCLLRKKVTSIVMRLMALRFVHSLSMISCIPLPTAWWLWSRSVNSYHLFEQSLRTSEFSWSSKRGFKCQKVLKGLQTNKQSFSYWNNL